MSAIGFEQSGYTYDGETFVLDDIDLHIDEGEFVCILGGNGSGKSTLAKHIDALLVPDRGRVSTLGMDTADDALTYAIRAAAGLVLQNPDDQIVASLVENDVAFGPENLGLETPELRERVSEALDRVGMAGFERVETSTLSGGQKQRLAIAGVLAMHPRILVLDEAGAMLDPRGRTGLVGLAHELNDAGMTVVMITHFMDEATGADRVVVLDRGRVAFDGAAADILTRVDELEALSLDIPFPVKMSRALRDRGLDCPIFIDGDELTEWIITHTGGGAR